MTASTAADTLHWVALRLVPGLGARRAHQLLESYRTPQAIFRASQSELVAHGLGPAVARCITSGAVFDEAVEQQEMAANLGAEILTYHDPRYPEQLRQIFDPPVLLYARGHLDFLETWMLAVVGSRTSTPYGIAVTERITGDLARAGLTIVSGMARGIDTAAHRAALAAGGRTIAVFGCGVDQVYPAENRALAATLAQDGLLLSEFPMGAPAYPQNFPIRNRIVAGLSLGILLVEGAQYSGSAITARLALDQNREVFAVPGNITSKSSWSPNMLIKQGAHLVMDASDVLEQLPHIARHQLANRPAAESLTASQASLFAGPNGPLATQIVEMLTVDNPVSLDDLLALLPDSSPSEIIATLFELELDSKVRQLPGKRFVRIWM